MKQAVRARAFTARPAMGIALAALLVLAGASLPLAPGFGAALPHFEDMCGLPATTLASSFPMLIAAGLLAGMSHCAGMCGPMVALYSARCRAAQSGLLTPVAAYHSGRIAMYALFGQLAGAFGQAARAGIVQAGWQAGISIAVGVAIAAAGLAMLGLLPDLTARGLPGLLAARTRSLINSNHPAAPFGLGVINAFMPCGATHALLLVAMSGGSAVQGGLVMLAFGLGTLPPMLGIAFAGQRLALPARGWMFQITAGMVMLVGVQLLLRGFAVSGLVPHGTLAGLVLW